MARARQKAGDKLNKDEGLAGKLRFIRLKIFAK